MPDPNRRLDPRPWRTVTVVSGPGAAAAVARRAETWQRTLWRVQLAGDEQSTVVDVLAGLCAAGAPLDAGAVAVARHRPPLDVLVARVVRPALALLTEAGTPLALLVELGGPPGEAEQRALELLIGEIEPPHLAYVAGDDRGLFAGPGVERVAVAGDDDGRDPADATGCHPQMPSSHGADAMDAMDAIGALEPHTPAWRAWQRLRRGDARLAARMAAALAPDPAAVEIEAAARLTLGERVDAPPDTSPPVVALAAASQVERGDDDPRTLDRLIAAANTAGWGWSPLAARLWWVRARLAWRAGALSSALRDADAAGLRAALVGDDGLAVEALALAAVVRAAQGDRDGAIGAARLAEQRAGPWPPRRIDEVVAAMMTRVGRLLELPPIRRPPAAPETADGQWAAALARLDADPAAEVEGRGPEWELLASLGRLADGDPGPLDAAIDACRAAELRGPLIELAGLIEARGGPTPPEAARHRPPRAERARRPLSPRETEVLSLAGRGLRNRQIGEALGIAASTVGIHLRNAYDKLGAHRREGAIKQARALGLI